MTDLQFNQFASNQSLTKKEKTIMNTKSKPATKIVVTLTLALVATVIAWSTLTAQEPAKKHEGHQEQGAAQTEPGVMHMNHITTQAEAEALQPGDFIAMACSMCKHITLQPVTKDNAHVKLMTVGENHKCDTCDGTVTVVGTGKGVGKDQAVIHVCSHCGDDAMFVCAVKPGTGTSKDGKDKHDMKNMKDMKHDKE